jgi:hypothetical protein
VNYSELPDRPSSLLEVHMKVSRHTPERGMEILGEWRFNDRGTGTKSFDFDIPR